MLCFILGNIWAYCTKSSLKLCCGWIHFQESDLCFFDRELALAVSQVCFCLLVLVIQLRPFRFMITKRVCRCLDIFESKYFSLKPRFSRESVRYILSGFSKRFLFMDIVVDIQPAGTARQAMLNRVRLRFFNHVGHETMYAFSGNKHFLLNEHTVSCPT